MHGRAGALAGRAAALIRRVGVLRVITVAVCGRAGTLHGRATLCGRADAIGGKVGTLRGKASVLQ